VEKDVIMTAVGILGLGTYLPPTVRTNDHWSAAVVADWSHRMAARLTQSDQSDDTTTPGVRLTVEAMSRYARDPFRGSVERRVMADDMTVPQMEANAAIDAMQRAGVRPDEIDVILTQTPAPEHLFVNSACTTHELLGLPRRCMSLGTEGACNAFAMHAKLAASLIASGQAKRVLSIHSCAMTRIMRHAEPDSSWWGDGAAAAVFGPVTEGKGLLANQHYSDGRSCDALVLGVANKRWWDDGAITLQAKDRAHTRAMVLSLVDRSRDTIHSTLAEAKLGPDDVDFYACHQGMVWLADVTAKHAGLSRAKTLTTFPMFGNLNSANVPMILAIAEREGMIRDGSIVSTFSGGVGETWSSLCLRWGR
jgi:3-oxoacyl-[acyl-carrier-protein] synthase-3